MFWIWRCFRSLKNVVGILDMDGFTIEKEFYCKELGIFKVGDVVARTYFFDLGIAGLIFVQRIESRVSM